MYPIRRFARWGAPLSLLLFFITIFSINCHGMTEIREKNGQPPPSKPLNKQIIIGYSGCAPSTDFWNKLTLALRLQASQMEVVLVDFSQEDFSLKRQQNNVHQAIDIGVDGMILGAVSDGLEGAISLLESHGIPVVTVGVPVKHDWVKTHVGTSSYDAARLAGLYILRNIGNYNKDEMVVIISGDEEQENSRIRGMVPRDILEDKGFGVVLRFSDNWSGVEAMKHAIYEFSLHGKNIRAVFTTFEPATIAMVEAAEKYNINALLVGFDWSDAMKKMVLDGRLHAAVIQDPTLIGRKGVEALVETLRGGEPPALIDVPPVLINQANVDLH